MYGFFFIFPWHQYCLELSHRGQSYSYPWHNDCRQIEIIHTLSTALGQFFFHWCLHLCFSNIHLVIKIALLWALPIHSLLCVVTSQSNRLSLCIYCKFLTFHEWFYNWFFLYSLWRIDFVIVVSGCLYPNTFMIPSHFCPFACRWCVILLIYLVCAFLSSSDISFVF